MNIDHLDKQTVDGAQLNLDALYQICPSCFTEAKGEDGQLKHVVNFEKLRALLGDNLEVLKLLQNSYMGKVKMIYIDPPYNTGNDFVYHDDFHRTQREEDEAAGVINEEGERMVKDYQGLLNMVTAD